MTEQPFIGLAIGSETSTFDDDAAKPLKENSVQRGNKSFQFSFEIVID
jgi:hypothetical protein